MLVWDIVQLVLIGLLAGEEFIVRYGIHPSIASLPDDAHVLVRIALVRRLKIVVPLLMVPAVLASIGLLIAAGSGVGLGVRIAGIVALAAFVLFSFLGTVPINMKVNDWEPAHPPADWHEVVRRWTNLDTFRSTAAIVSFVCFVVALAVRAG